MGGRVRHRAGPVERIWRRLYRATLPPLGDPRDVATSWVTAQVSAGPVCRVLCLCGRKLAGGTSALDVSATARSRPAADDMMQSGWECDRCGRWCPVELVPLMGAWLAAQRGDRTVRLPLADRP